MVPSLFSMENFRAQVWLSWCFESTTKQCIVVTCIRYHKPCMLCIRVLGLPQVLIYIYNDDPTHQWCLTSEESVTTVSTMTRTLSTTWVWRRFKPWDSAEVCLDLIYLQLEAWVGFFSSKPAWHHLEGWDVCNGQYQFVEHALPVTFDLYTVLSSLLLRLAFKKFRSCDKYSFI